MRSQKFPNLLVLLGLIVSLPVSAKLSGPMGPNTNPSSIGIGEVDPQLYKACQEEGDKDRGKLGNPAGYLLVMLKAFARSVCRPDDDTAKTAMLKGSSNGSKDALNGEVKDTRKNSAGGELAEEQTLIDDYLLLLGLGMRESTGKFNEGADKKAGNTGAAEEAGAFQTSADIKGCIKDEHAKVGLNDLEQSYVGARRQDCMSDLAEVEDGYVPDASKGVEQFKGALKKCPALAAEHAAITIRHCKDHYGPLVRNEAKKMEACKPLLIQVAKNLQNNKAACLDLYQYGKFNPNNVGNIQMANGASGGTR